MYHGCNNCNLTSCPYTEQNKSLCPINQLWEIDIVVKKLVVAAEAKLGELT